MKFNLLKVNKKGSGIMTFITNALIYAIIIFIIFAIWGTSGGFSSIVGLGKLMSQIPSWIYLALGGAWVIGKIIGK